MSYCYQYPRPALTVDAVVFRFDESGLKLLLIRRAQPPFEACWAFPGGYVEIDEPLIHVFLDPANLQQLENVHGF